MCKWNGKCRRCNRQKLFRTTRAYARHLAFGCGKCFCGQDNLNLGSYWSALVHLKHDVSEHWSTRDPLCDVMCFIEKVCSEDAAGTCQEENSN